jgi:hypothetical protein
MVEPEQEQMVQAKNPKKKSKSDELKSFMVFIKSMIQFMIKDMKSIPEELIIIILEIFINFLNGTETTLKVKFKKSKLKRSKAKWKSEMLLSYRQDIMISLGLVELIVDVLSSDVSQAIKKKMTKLGIVILEGGNRNAQNRWIEILKKDERNQFFVSLNQIIETEFGTIVKHLTAQNENQMNLILEEDLIGSIGVPLKEMERRERSSETQLHTEEVELNMQRSTKIIILMIRLMQLLCEGNNQEMKNLMRDQATVTNSHFKRDFVSIISKMFSRFIKINSRISIAVGIQMLEFLIEVTQGPCEENQVRLVNCKIIDHCIDLLHDISMKREFKDISNFESENKLNVLIGKSISLFLSLLEGNQEKKLTVLIGANINYDFLINNLVQEFKLFLRRKKIAISVESFMKNIESLILDKDFFDERMQDAFNIYFFILMLNSESPDLKSLTKDLQPEHKLVCDFFHLHTGSVEIKFKSKLKLAYFVKHPSCNYLPGALKDQFIQKHAQDTGIEKITNFVRVIPELMDKMDFAISLQSSKLKLTQGSFALIKDLTLYFSCLINLVMFVWSDKVIVDSQYVGDIIDFENSDYFIKITGIIHLLLTIMSFLAWVKVVAPSLAMDTTRNAIQDMKIMLREIEIDSEEHELCRAIIGKDVSKLTMEDRLTLLNYRDKLEGKAPSTLQKPRILMDNLVYMLNSSECLTYMVMMLLSMLAYIYEFYFLYYVFLFKIIDKSDTLQNVILAFTRNADQIFLTIIFESIIIYIYSSFAYFYVSESFYNYTIGTTGENLCVGMWHCFLTTFALVISLNEGSKIQRRRRRGHHPPVLP